MLFQKGVNTVFTGLQNCADILTDNLLNVDKRNGILRVGTHLSVLPSASVSTIYTKKIFLIKERKSGFVFKIIDCRFRLRKRHCLQM